MILWIVPCMMMLNSCSWFPEAIVERTDFVPPTLIKERNVSCHYDTYRDLIECLIKTQNELKKCNYDKKSIAKIINKKR